MSVRAYKIIKKEIEESPTFNLWRDEEVMDYLRQNDLLCRMEDGGGGTIELSRENYEEIIALTGVDNGVIEALHKDFKGLGDCDYVSYECY